MHIAIEGCAHGELEKIYETISQVEKQENYKVDLLICCGDFQASRNLDDLEAMAVPKKYQDICTFYKYYSGEKIAPMLTVFIGGNHEASNHLQELPYGGWVAQNIYYLGYAGVVNVNGVRIAGISGIYKGHDFLKGHHEFAPYNESTRKSVYHTRQLEVFRLKQLSGNIDIFLSHDWPRGIYNYGNSKQLIRFKPHFREEIENNKLGSPPCEELLNVLQPAYWFSAHMHCKFAALVPHEDSGKITKFLALDKCLPKRRFLQVLEMNTDDYTDDEKLKFEYDLEWLTILYLTNHLINVKNSIHYMPGPNAGAQRYDFTPTDDEKEFIRKKFCNNFRIPTNFIRNTEPYNPDEKNAISRNPISKINSQTTEFCDILGIDDPLSLAMTISGLDISQSSSTTDGNDSSCNNLLLDSNDQLSFNSSCENNVISPLKRKSIGLSLPKPKDQKEMNAEEIDVEEDQDKEEGDEESKEIEISTIEKLESTTVSETSLEVNTVSITNLKEDDAREESKPPIKKFKRRNLDIYSGSNEEE